MINSQYEQFLNKVKSIAHNFEKIDKDKSIKIISHYDCDGISSGAILCKTLEELGYKFNIEFVQQLTENYIEQISNIFEEIIFFTDLGSSQAEFMSRFLADKTVFILDHHSCDSNDSIENHANPHNFGITSPKEISGAGVVYFFCKELYPEIVNYSHLAVIGSIGDVQENNGFIGLNNIIFQDAISSRKIEILQGPRMFGIQTKPIMKILAYSNDYKIPGFYKNEKVVQEFLDHIGIEWFKDVENEKKYLKNYFELNENDKQILNDALIEKSKGTAFSKDMIGNVYKISNNELGPTVDAKEFSTLLNSCGRLNRAELGIGVCLEDINKTKEAIELKQNYSNEINSLVRWFDDRISNEEDVKITDNYIIINARNEVSSNMIGTLASILSKSNRFKAGMVIVSMARNEDNTTKISMRATGFRPKGDFNLKDVLDTVLNIMDGSSGGHQYAAGAMVNTSEENKFIKLIEENLNLVFNK